MKKRKTLFVVTIVIMTMLASGIPASAFSPNESRSMENFFIDAQLLKGDGSGYGLDKPATRLEGIVILIRLMGQEAEAQGMKDQPCQFADVPDWAKGYVNYAYAGNISKGVSDTRFGVGEQMTASQFNTLLLRILGYDDSQGDFQWDDSISKAGELSILPDDTALKYTQYAAYTKGDLMETAFCYLEANYKDQQHTLIQNLIENGVISDQLAEEYGLDVEGWDAVTTGDDQDNYLNFKVSDDELNVTGASEDRNKTYLLIRVLDTKTGVKKADKNGRINGDGRYDISLSLGRLPEGEYYIDVYGNHEKYNYYTSFILSSLILKKTADGSYFEAAPVYGRNLRTHNGNQLQDSDYAFTNFTNSRQEYKDTVSAQAEQITAGVSGDYEKTRAIHDWVAENIYYDKDYLDGKTDRTNVKSISVLRDKYAVCSGYANLTNDLLAASGIPSRQVIGFALGVTDKEDNWDEVDLKRVEPNHVWNEAYVDGRWIILDATWDSNNTYEGGKFTEGDGPSGLFFDATVPFLSNTHEMLMP